MKRFAPIALVVSLLLVVVVPWAFAASAQPAAAPPLQSWPAAPVATAISTVTGIAISPLLGTSAYGAYKWYTAKDDAARAALPWYAQMKFWLPALLLVGLCAAKDTFGAIVPTGLKKPLDVLEVIENKFSGLIAAGAVVPFAIDAMNKLLVGDGPSASAPVLAHGGGAAIHLGAVDLTWLLDVMTIPFGVAVFLVVWLASHAINVLILLSPWGAIDAGLKIARTALLGLITLTATMNPWLSAGLSLVVIVVAFFVAGWSFRLTVFGSIFCWEFVTGRGGRFSPTANANAMFAGAAFPNVPVRTYGRLMRRADGQLEFAYHPWLVLPRRSVLVPLERRSLAVGKGALFSEVVDAADRTVFSLPPRYFGHEAKLAAVYGWPAPRPIGLHKIWAEFRDMLGGRAVKQAQLTA